MDSVGERIKRSRISKGFTQADLATVLDTTTAAISRYEQSKRVLDFAQVQAIADFLEVSVFDLYGIPSDRQIEIEKSQKFLSQLKEQIRLNSEGGADETMLAVNKSLQLAADAIEKKLQDEIKLAYVVHRAQVEVALISRPDKTEFSSDAPKPDLAAKRRNKRVDSLVGMFNSLPDDAQNRILDAVSTLGRLNSAGQKRAIGRIKELAELPRYQVQKEEDAGT